MDNYIAVVKYWTKSGSWSTGRRFEGNDLSKIFADTLNHTKAMQQKGRFDFVGYILQDRSTIYTLNCRGDNWIKE